jgi:response regulator of citrate/malate metabolism
MHRCNAAVLMVAAWDTRAACCKQWQQTPQHHHAHKCAAAVGFADLNTAAVQHVVRLTVMQGLPRAFNQWGTLRQRLKEVKQSARKLETQPDSQQPQLLPQRHATQDSDDSCTVSSGTCSAMEAKIEQLLAQPLVPTAVTAVVKAGAAAADGSSAADAASSAAAAGAGGAGTLNLILRR